jgi:uncharacterized membrane protein YgaE (UPF0421/DUF939 family)
MEIAVEKEADAKEWKRTQAAEAKRIFEEKSAKEDTTLVLLEIRKQIRKRRTEIETLKAMEEELLEENKSWLPQALGEIHKTTKKKKEKEEEKASEKAKEPELKKRKVNLLSEVDEKERKKREEKILRDKKLKRLESKLRAMN